MPACTYPLTGLRCVSRVYTDYATFEIGPDGPRVRETWGITRADLLTRLNSQS